jgi:hypothetical protein
MREATRTWGEDGRSVEGGVRMWEAAWKGYRARGHAVEELTGPGGGTAKRHYALGSLGMLRRFE